MPDCTRCPLHKECLTVCMEGSGPNPCDVLIVGEAPGATEDEIGKPFVGETGELLAEMLEEVGMDIDDCHIINAVSCRPLGNRTPKAKEINSCRYWVRKRIKEVEPKYVLLLGNTAMKSILDDGILPQKDDNGKKIKWQGIRSRRGKTIEYEGIVYFPTYHPAYILRDERHKPTLASDLSRFCQIVENRGIPKEDDLNYRIVKNLDDAEEMFKDLIGVVSIDTETTGLYPWVKDFSIVSIGFGTRTTQWCLPVDYPGFEWDNEEIEYILDRLDEIVQDLIVVMHSAKFDCLVIKTHWGYSWHCNFDTQLAHHILDENNYHSLKILSKVYCGAPDYDIDLDSKKGATTLEKHCEYLGLDVFYTRKLKFIFTKMLKSQSAVKELFEQVVMPVSDLYTEIAEHGVFIDIEGLEKVSKQLENNIEKLLKRLNKYTDINWNSTQQLAKFLFEDIGINPIKKTPGGANSTDEDTLKQIDHPIVKDLLEYRHDTKQHSTYVLGWQKFLEGPYLHPNVLIHGTVTGRPSYKEPNLQQTPREGIIRNLVKAPEGYTHVEFDLSQIEMRIIAELSGDKTLNGAFEMGDDVHWKTAMREIERGMGFQELVISTAEELSGEKLGYSESIALLKEVGHNMAIEAKTEWKELRKKAKAVNFGYSFGMWWKRFIIYARTDYDIIVKPKEAQQSRESFFELYPGIEEWHKRQRHFARRNGYVVSLSGRKRRLPDAMLNDKSPKCKESERQAINSPVQGFASDINLMVAIQVREEFPPPKVFLTGTIHDANLARVRNDVVEEFCERVDTIMRKPKLFDELNINLQVPISGEVEIGPWGAGVSLEKWLKISK